MRDRKRGHFSGSRVRTQQHDALQLPIIRAWQYGTLSAVRFETRAMGFICFLLFSPSLELPLACESSHEYSISIFIDRGFVYHEGLTLLNPNLN